MTKLAYLDCPTGIAGDMCLGALVASGVPLDYLIEKLKGLGIDDEYRLWAESVNRNNQLATKVHVDLLNQPHHRHDESHPHPHPHPHEDALALSGSSKTEISHHHHNSVDRATRYLPEIERLIVEAGLPPRVVERSLAIFRHLAKAEGLVHGIPSEKVHFHEVGATDAIVDIVGTCLGLDWLGIDKIYCSPMPTGGGTVWAAHGRLPVPVPAVMKLWELHQVPVYSNGIERELVTPTGAAIAVTLATSFGAPPPMIIEQVGLGAGSSLLPIPNILRLWIGESGESGVGNRELLGDGNWQISHPQSPDLETICVLETQIDDLSPQAIGYVYDVLFNAGALDVFTQPIGMKKSRPGILLTVICFPENLTVCEDVLFRETTTLGIRHFTQQRTILHREIQEVKTDYGVVRVKVASRGAGGAKEIANVQPEYEDCAAIARAYHLSWREVHQLAMDAWYLQQR